MRVTSSTVSSSESQAKRMPTPYLPIHYVPETSGSCDNNFRSRLEQTNLFLRRQPSEYRQNLRTETISIREKRELVYREGGGEMEGERKRGGERGRERGGERGGERERERRERERGRDRGGKGG